jgi:hypothetical protein
MNLDARNQPRRRTAAVLVLLFVATLPLVNPWIRGDGVGYYAYARSILIQHQLDFRPDWIHANASFQIGRVDDQGNVLPRDYTVTGHLDNHFSIGPAMLWLPLLAVTHAVVLGVDRLGAHVAADGFSRPYRYTIALATATYGFLGLWFSMSLARRYFAERWAVLAMAGIWFASSLPVYMYFNPSWSHAHSAFIAALFLWYWDRTRGERGIGQWAILGALAGLLMDVYYPNIFLILAPGLESLGKYIRGFRQPAERQRLFHLFEGNLAFAAAAVLALLPTMITREIVYGSPSASGYVPLDRWDWFRPSLVQVLFSSDHGLLSWTPILLPAIAGLLALYRKDRELATILIAITGAFYYLIASYPTWDGLSSFGNRFFISLTPIFVIGLAGAFQALEEFWNLRRAQFVAYGATALLILWNFGFIFQWGTHLVPARGPISWSQMVSNQFVVVPSEIVRTAGRYATHRGALMKDIEDTDVQQLRRQQASSPPEQQ